VTPKGQTRDPNALSPISRKRLEIETPFQSRPTTNRKWPTGYRTVTWPMSSRDPKGQARDPNTLGVHYVENSWKCYLASRYYSLIGFLFSI